MKKLTRPAARRASSTTLSTVQLARVLDVSVATVLRWAKAGQIPAVRTLGGHHRFSPAQVEQIKRRMGAPTSPGDAA